MATGLYSPVTITKHGTSGINIPNIRAQGFIPSGASSPGFQIADIFQEGPKVFTSTDPNLIAQYGDEFVEVITPEGNLRLPSGGINLGAGTFGFGTEVVSTPTQADKGMRLVENSDDYKFTKNLMNKYKNIHSFAIGYDAGYGCAVNKAVEKVETDYFVCMNPEKTPSTYTTKTTAEREE